MTEAESYDVVLAGGMLIDGTGAPRRKADVGIRAGRIAGIGDLSRAQAARRIDIAGRIVAPGFIDVHTHDDGALVETPHMDFKATQGVTTVVCGNCGVSAAPFPKGRQAGSVVGLVARVPGIMSESFGEYIEKVEAARPAINGAFLVGHSTLRQGFMDDIERPATPKEIDLMQRKLDESLAQGAIGMSSGTFYPPAAKATADEIAGIAAPLGRRGAVYTAHIRDEGDHVIDSLEEVFDVGRRAGARTIVSHHKCTGVRNRGRTRETLALFDKVRAKQDVALDVYPYIAGSTILRVDRMMDSDRVLVTWSQPMPQHAGRDLDDIAREMGVDRTEAAKRLIPGGAIYFMMGEEDVRRVLAYPGAMIGSDGIPGDAHPHPRLWGTFPRVLGHYCRELKLMGLEEAIRRMTSLPARNFNLKDRGEIRLGAFADLVVFDAASIADRATFEKPVQASAGIDHVLVNGVEILAKGQDTGARPGKALRRAG
jgi:N-acyl-D-amino-acid deacylase